MAWAGSHPWHEVHTSHNHRSPGQGVLVRADYFISGLRKDEGAAPHLDGGTAHAQNDQASVAGTSKAYGRFAAPYGTVDKAKPASLKFYPLQGLHQSVDAQVAHHGYTHYYAGPGHAKPDLANKNFNTGHLMIYAPEAGGGGDFGDTSYTDAWRKQHELAHALTYPSLNAKYGEGRRIGGLGKQRTIREAKRAVEWEWMAAHKQRELAGQIGVHIPDEQFHRELNTVMHDAVHRAVTGKFTDPESEGFNPHPHKVPLETALQMVDEAGRSMGLADEHQTLKKSSLRDHSGLDNTNLSTTGATIPMADEKLTRNDIRDALVVSLKKMESVIVATEARERAGTAKLSKNAAGDLQGNTGDGTAMPSGGVSAIQKADSPFAKPPGHLLPALKYGPRQDVPPKHKFEATEGEKRHAAEKGEAPSCHHCLAPENHSFHKGALPEVGGHDGGQGDQGQAFKMAEAAPEGKDSCPSCHQRVGTDKDGATKAHSCRGGEYERRDQNVHKGEKPATPVAAVNKELGGFKSLASNPTALPGNVKPKLGKNATEGYSAQMASNTTSVANSTPMGKGETPKEREDRERAERDDVSESDARQGVEDERSKKFTEEQFGKNCGPDMQKDEGDGDGPTPPCPKCNGAHTELIGTYGGKTHYLCKACGDDFSAGHDPRDVAATDAPMGKSDDDGVDATDQAPDKKVKGAKLPDGAPSAIETDESGDISKGRKLAKDVWNPSGSEVGKVRGSVIARQISTATPEKKRKKATEIRGVAIEQTRNPVASAGAHPVMTKDEVPTAAKAGRPSVMQRLGSGGRKPLPGGKMPLPGLTAPLPGGVGVAGPKVAPGAHPDTQASLSSLPRKPTPAPLAALKAAVGATPPPIPAAARKPTVMAKLRGPTVAKSEDKDGRKFWDKKNDGKDVGHFAPDPQRLGKAGMPMAPKAPAMHDSKSTPNPMAAQGGSAPASAKTPKASSV